MGWTEIITAVTTAVVTVIGSLGGREAVAFWLKKRAGRRADDEYAKRIRAMQEQLYAHMSEQMRGLAEHVEKLEREAVDIRRQLDECNRDRLDLRVKLDALERTVNGGK